MTDPEIVIFIKERALEDRVAWRITQEHYESILAILKCHEEWPILMRHKPEPAVINSLDDYNSVRFSLIQTIEWSTQQSYKERFGEDPPTTPVVLALARIWRTHENFMLAWA